MSVLWPHIDYSIFLFIELHYKCKNAKDTNPNRTIIRWEKKGLKINRTNSDRERERKKEETKRFGDLIMITAMEFLN